MIRIYGIRNCDTIKKTLAWFDQEGADYEFIDYKKSPPTEALLRSWIPHVGWENLINKRGTTWRKLDSERQDKLNLERGLELMIEYPSIIKRPVVEHGGLVSIGYNEQAFRDLLSLEL